MRFAVIQICCDRQDGVAYFEDYDSAAKWRSYYEGDWTPGSFEHHRTGVLLGVDKRDAKPPHVGLEEHQRWIWLNGAERPHWEVRGTGAL